MTLLKKSITFSLLAFLAGCSSSPKDPGDSALKYMESFQEFNLQDTNHSEAMQVMHLHSRRAVANANNIDNFTAQNHNKFISATQGVAVGAAVAGSINPFQLATTLVGLEATKSSIDKKYRKNTLISIAPVSDLQDVNEIRKVIDNYHTKQLEVARSAYQQAGFQTNTVRSGVEVKWSYIFPRTAVIPMDSSLEKVELCQNPDVFSELKDRTIYGDVNFECFAMTNPISYLYQGNSDNLNNALLPESNAFIVITTKLPDVFPIFNIEMKEANDGVLLYQPTFYWMNSGNIQDFALNDMDELLGYWEKSMFSDEPKLTDLATGQIHKFGTK